MQRWSLQTTVAHGNASAPVSLRCWAVAPRSQTMIQESIESQLIKVRKHASHCLEERLHSTIESAVDGKNICHHVGWVLAIFYEVVVRSLEATMTLPYSLSGTHQRFASDTQKPLHPIA